MATAGRFAWLSRFLCREQRNFHFALYIAGTICALKLGAEHLLEIEGCDGPSMIPTLHRYGDSLIISKLHKYGRGIQVGDIIVYKQPQFSQIRSTKRVLGMPGDYVVTDVPCRKGEPDVNEQSKMLQVPEGHVWVVGDNLPYSRDSRMYGPVPMGLITGKVIGRWYWYTGTGFVVERIVNPFSQSPVETP